MGKVLIAIGTWPTLLSLLNWISVGGLYKRAYMFFGYLIMWVQYWFQWSRQICSKFIFTSTLLIVPESLFTHLLENTMWKIFVMDYIIWKDEEENLCYHCNINKTTCYGREYLILHFHAVVRVIKDIRSLKINVVWVTFYSWWSR